MESNKIGNIRITANNEHPSGWVTNLDGEIIKGVTSVSLDLQAGNIPKAGISIVCDDFDIEAKLTKANVTIVKNAPEKLRDLDLRLSWLKGYFESHPKDFDEFEAAIANHTYLGNSPTQLLKFLDIFRAKPLGVFDYSLDHEYSEDQTNGNN